MVVAPAFHENRTGPTIDACLTASPDRVPEEASSAEHRVIVALLACVARWGLAKTTLEDVAREAGISRATLYRLFPGGKPTLFEAAARHEVTRLLVEVSARFPRAESVEDVLVEAIHGGATFLARHRAFSALLSHEPEVLMPFLAFDRQGPILAASAAFITPDLDRFVDRSVAEEISEWVARLVISYTVTPSASINLADLGVVRDLVRQHFLPGIAAAASEPIHPTTPIPEPT